jgi:hypothetical protein
MGKTIFTRAFDRRVRTLLAVVGASVVVGGAFGTHVLWQGNMSQGYAPAQPIAFNHAIMAGQRHINCLYCHTEALRGPHAGIPPVSTCMRCHKVIQTKDAEGKLKVGLAQLNRYWAEKKPIRWVKVHDLADFVYFNHSRHLLTKKRLPNGEKIWCQTCHGAVETMDRVVRVNNLKMGWCLQCHMQPAPPGSPPGQTTLAPISCTTCHR